MITNKITITPIFIVIQATRDRRMKKVDSIRGDRNKLERLHENIKKDSKKKILNYKKGKLDFKKEASLAKGGPYFDCRKINRGKC